MPIVLPDLSGLNLDSSFRAAIIIIISSHVVLGRFGDASLVVAVE